MNNLHQSNLFNLYKKISYYLLKDNQYALNSDFFFKLLINNAISYQQPPNQNLTV